MRVNTVARRLGKEPRAPGRPPRPKTQPAQRCRKLLLNFLNGDSNHV
jgi:hypothetical protein